MSAQAEPGGNMRVFVLNDSSAFRKRLLTALSRLPGIEVLEAPTEPLGALSSIRESKPDAVILDTRSRRRFGTDLVRHIKKMTPAPFVVLLTNGLIRQGSKGGAEEADFSFDKFTELEKMTALFEQFRPDIAKEDGSLRLACRGNG